MFALTVSNGSARLLGLIILTSSTFGSATWILGRDGESCLQACFNVSQLCTEAQLMLQNSNVSSEAEMRHVIESQFGTCTKYNAKYGRSADVPVYQASSGECYVSAPEREIGTFKCDRAPPVGKQRLCWCHNVTLSAQSAEAVLNDESGISAKMFVVLLSSVMLCLGLVGMGFGIARRLRKRALGIPEGTSMKERPKDTGYYIRCPNCGCPVGESRSVKSWALADVNDPEKTTHANASTKSTRTNASAKSNCTNSPSYTHCPACQCPLGFPLTEGSQPSSNFDITVSRAFRPGGSFIDLEEGNLKMGDCNSPSHVAAKTPESATAAKTPKSALRKSALTEPAHI